MKPALAFEPPKPPSRWQQLPNGKAIAEAIDAQIAPWLDRMFGYHMLKIGSLSCGLNTEKSTIKHQVCVLEHSSHIAKNSENVKSKSLVYADVDDLPFQKHSVDVALLSHCLEFTVDPHHVVREANRVVIPQGYLVITGFNPLSLAGLNRFIPFRRQKFPWAGRFFTSMRVKDWLHLMGYDILDDIKILPFGLETERNLENWWNRKWRAFAERYLSAFGSVYIIVAKKRKFPLTPIKPKWQVRAKFAPINAPSLNTRTVQNRD